MRMSIDKVPVVLTEFLDTVLLPKSTSTTQTFMSAFAIGVAGRRLQGMFKSAGLADGSGMLDLDELEAAANAAISKAQVIDIPVIGYRADADDIRRLFQIAKKFGVQ